MDTLFWQFAHQWTHYSDNWLTCTHSSDNRSPGHIIMTTCSPVDTLFWQFAHQWTHYSNNRPPAHILLTTGHLHTLFWQQASPGHIILTTGHQDTTTGHLDTLFWQQATWTHYSNNRLSWVFELNYLLYVSHEKIKTASCNNNCLRFCLTMNWTEDLSETQSWWKLQAFMWINWSKNKTESDICIKITVLLTSNANGHLLVASDAAYHRPHLWAFIAT